MEGENMMTGKRCYVGNLAWRTSWQDLKDKFAECGSVTYANVMRTEDGRSKGWGIVEFDSPDQALKAIQTLNGMELDGRPITVREDRDNREGGGGGGMRNFDNRGGGGPRYGGGAPDGCKVVVHGLPFRYSWRELKDLFNENIGGVAHAEVVMGRDGRSKGWGTVRFESPDVAQKAIEVMDGSDLEGRQLGVHLDRFG